MPIRAGGGFRIIPVDRPGVVVDVVVVADVVVVVVVLMDCAGLSSKNEMPGLPVGI